MWKTRKPEFNACNKNNFNKKKNANFTKLGTSDDTALETKDIAGSGDELAENEGLVSFI